MTRGLVRAWILGAMLVLSGCGSDSDTDSPPKVPTLELVKLYPSGRPEFDWTSAEVALPCDGRIAVGLIASNWSARAPGGCGQTSLCGHVEAIATAASGETSDAAFAVSSPLLRLPADRLGDWVGRGSILARLVRDDSTPYLDPTGAQVTATRDVVFNEAVDCDNTDGAGGNGAGGTGGTDATGGSDSSGAGESSAGAGGAAN